MIKKYYLMKSIGTLIIALFSGFIYIFLIDKNISESQIGTLIFVFWISSLIFEIPSGMLSDYFGRRKIYIFSTILRILGLLLIAYTNYIATIVLGFIITGISDAFSSGCLEAWVFDNIDRDHVDHVTVNSSRISTLLSSLAGVAGVKLFYSISGEFVLVISCVLLLINSILSFVFICEENHNDVNKAKSIKDAFLKIIEETKEVFLSKDQQITFVTLISTLAITIAVIPGSYYQLLFTKFKIVENLLLVSSLFIPTAAIIGQTLYKRFYIQENLLSLDVIILLSSVSIIGSTLMINGYFSMALFLFHVLLTAIVEIFIFSFINKNIDKNRNTIISVVFFIQSLLSSVLLFLASLIIKFTSVAIMEVSITLGIVSIYFLIIFTKKFKNGI